MFALDRETQGGGALTWHRNEAVWWEEGEWSLGREVLHEGCGTLWKREMFSPESYIVPMDEVPFADLP